MGVEFAAPVVILGAGPAGLSAAYELAGKGVASIVLEQDSVVGGLARTICGQCKPVISAADIS